MRSGIIGATSAQPPDPVVPDDDPLAPARGLSLPGLIDLLEALDGHEEAAVVRAALAGGVPDAVVVEEVQREVERRLMRARGFYDDLW
jgi:hypothetical protein